MRQYEVWWARLPEPAGERPVLLLSRNDVYSTLNKFTAAAITTTIRDIPVEVALGTEEGLPQPCVANFDDLLSVARHRLIRRLGRLRFERTNEVKQALGYALGWEELVAIRH